MQLVPASPKENVVAWLDVAPGEPMLDGLVESLNGRLRDERRNAHLFRTLTPAHQLIEERRIDHRHTRPHTGLGGLTPSQFATRSQREHNENRVQ